MNRSGDIEQPSAARQKRLIDAAWEQVEQAASTQAAAATGDRIVPPLERRPPGALPGALPGYRIVREVHRGGQGVVYQAVQASTGRQVAIKVMHGGPFAGPREKARFEREVHVLAQLKHPNIVTVHDSGAAGDSVFFVMDFIEGHPLDQYARKFQPGLRDRLRLFARICAAVHVAHLRGVIHRDLKPGNIRIDAAGQPHVLDFGLAKTTDWDASRSGPEEVITLTGQFLGSLPWASPEQAQGLHDETDLRTDVYSLGVMLYQLLTGAFPYGVSGSFSETAHNVIHADPKNPRTLNRELDDEIIAIVLKALKKERELRYQSAGAFGADIERYLDGEPIEAKRDSMTYVLRKHLVRHKAAAGVVALFVAVVTIGFGVSLSFWRQAALARDAESDQKHAAQRSAAAAERAAARAEAESAKARAVTEFLTDMLASADPDEMGRKDATVREVLDAASRRVDEGTLADKPQIEAAVHRVLGASFSSLGASEPAHRHAARAKELYEQIEGPDSEETLRQAIRLADVLRSLGKVDEAEAAFRETADRIAGALGRRHLLMAQCLRGLSGVLRDRKLPDEAEPPGAEAVEIQRALGETETDEYASALNDLAIVYQDQGRMDDALTLQLEALDTFRRIYGDDHQATAVARFNVAVLYTQQARFPEAETIYQEALATMRRVYGDEHPTTVTCLNSLGLLYVKQKRLPEARQALTESLTTARTLFGNEHPKVGMSLNSLAIVQYELGDLEAAVESFRECARIFTNIYGADSPSVLTIEGNMAAVMRVRGDVEGALPVLRGVLERRRALLGENHPTVIGDLHNVGITLNDLRRFDEAAPILREALRLRTGVRGADHPETIESKLGLAGALHGLGQLEEAESQAREALAALIRTVGEGHLSTAGGMDTLALVLTDRGQAAEAEELYRSAVAICERELPQAHWRTAVYRGHLGAQLAARGRFDEAEPLLLAAYEAIAATQGDERERTQRIIQELVELYEAWQRPEEADRWRAKRIGG
ncbi:MAG: hypothetical protein C4547_12740 [Phycisphaerales bacterium]|nr:MAG: hypothetical protein C4547_12740 [Phycisphaerales bacterium]